MTIFKNIKNNELENIELHDDGELAKSLKVGDKLVVDHISQYPEMKGLVFYTLKLA